MDALMTALASPLKAHGTITVDNAAGSPAGTVTIGVESSLEAPVFGTVYKVAGPDAGSGAQDIEFCDLGEVRMFVGELVAGELAKAGAASRDGDKQGVWSAHVREGALVRRAGGGGMRGNEKIKIVVDGQDGDVKGRASRLQVKLIRGDETVAWMSEDKVEGKSFWDNLEEMKG